MVALKHWVVFWSFKNHAGALSSWVEHRLPGHYWVIPERFGTPGWIQLEAGIKAWGSEGSKKRFQDVSIHKRTQNFEWFGGCGVCTLWPSWKMTRFNAHIIPYIPRSFSGGFPSIQGFNSLVEPRCVHHRGRAGGCLLRRGLSPGPILEEHLLSVECIHSCMHMIIYMI